MLKHKPQRSLCCACKMGGNHEYSSATRQIIKNMKLSIVILARTMPRSKGVQTGHFIAGERASHMNGMGCRTGLDKMVKRKTCPCRESNPSSPTHSLVTILSELSLFLAHIQIYKNGLITLISAHPNSGSTIHCQKLCG